nr:hypothetical protein [Tanacetum cinerariifolium]
MDLLSFIWTVDPTKVRVGERERDEGEPKLLETTVGRVVPLLPVAPDHSFGELEASVDKLFDEGGSGEQANQGDSTGGGHGVSVQLVDVSAKTVAKMWLLLNYNAKRNKKPKLLMLGLGYAYFAIVSSCVSTTPEREEGDYTKLLAGANLRIVEAPQRFVIFSDSSDPSGVNIAEAEVDFVVRTFVPIMMNATMATPTADPAAIAKEKLVSALVFGGDSSFVGESHPISGGFSDRTGGDFLGGGIRIVVDPNSNLQRVYVPHWNATNGFCMDDGGVCHEMISLGAEVPMRAKYNIKEKRRLKSVVEEKDSLPNSTCDEIESLKAKLLIKEVEAVEADRLCNKAQALKERNTCLEKDNSELEIKVTDLVTSVKVREQEVADLDVVVTSVKLQNDSLADQVHKLEVASFRFQEKLSHYENLTERHGSSSRGKVLPSSLPMAWNLLLPSAYTLLSIFLCLEWPLGRLLRKECKMELRSNKDAIVDTIMNILRLEDNLTKMLDVSGARVRKIRENIVSQRPTLRDVFTVIFEPFSTEVLMDDYEIAHTEGREDSVADVKAIVKQSQKGRAEKDSVFRDEIGQERERERVIRMQLPLDFLFIIL